MANFKGHPPAGRPLPRDWQTQAKLNAMQADAGYLHGLENAWRQPLGAQPLGIMQAARLQQQTSSQPPAPPRRDARADQRMDGMMILIQDDSFEQVWKDATGAIVTIRKQRK